MATENERFETVQAVIGHLKKEIPHAELTPKAITPGGYEIQVYIPRNGGAEPIMGRIVLSRSLLDDKDLGAVLNMVRTNQLSKKITEGHNFTFAVRDDGHIDTLE